MVFIKKDFIAFMVIVLLHMVVRPTYLMLAGRKVAILGYGNVGKEWAVK
jgi:S-adenosylhomocysteine hydrolase